MMLNVAGGVIIAAAICALFAWGVFGVIEDRRWFNASQSGQTYFNRSGLTEPRGWALIVISTGLAIVIVLF